MLLESLKEIDSTSLDIDIDIDQIRNFEKTKTKTNATNSSQFFPSKFSDAVNKLYSNFNYFTGTQQLILFGILLGSIFTSKNYENHYRIDKSPSSTNEYNINDWYNFFDEEMDYLTDLEDQPRYSYNQAYLLAQKLGLKTKYEL